MLVIALMVFDFAAIHFRDMPDYEVIQDTIHFLKRFYSVSLEKGYIIYRCVLIF